MRSLFEQFGGFAAVSRITMTFYEHVLDSDAIAPYFEHVEMERLIDHQTRFIASLLGGPASFSDAHLAAAHHKLGITHAEFDELLAILRTTLDEHGFEATDQDAVVRAFESRRQFIVAKS